MRKARELKYWETDKKELDKWFLTVASPTRILKKLGMARSTTAKYRKEISEQGKSLQDLVTITTYRTLISMQNEELAAQLQAKKLAKAKKAAKKKASEANIKKMKANLEKLGFDVVQKKSESKPISDEKIAKIKKKNDKPSEVKQAISLDEFKQMDYAAMQKYVNRNKHLLTGKKAYQFLTIMQKKKKEENNG